MTLQTGLLHCPPKSSCSCSVATVLRPRLVSLVYLIIGVAVAATHDYFEKLDTVRLLLSALLAVLLWPLVLLGIDLHIKK